MKQYFVSVQTIFGEKLTFSFLGKNFKDVNFLPPSSCKVLSIIVQPIKDQNYVIN